jgi:hypothetical protein
MDMRRQNGRPAPRPTTNTSSQPAAPTVSTASPAASATKSGSGKGRFIGSAVAALVLLSAGFALGNVMPAFGGESGRVDKSKYQAVFLTNDQVYFGKITDISDEVVVMEDIYYLQKGADQAADAKQEASSPSQNANMSLAKLGSELHAPEDRMQINKDQVLFWENLKEDGKVSAAIKDYQK